MRALLTQAIDNTAMAEWAGRLAFASLGFIFSPGWWVARQVLAPYFDLDGLLREGLTLSVMMGQVEKLRALGPDVVRTEVIPALFLCLVVSIGGIFLYAWLGRQAARLCLSLCRPDMQGG